MLGTGRGVKLIREQLGPKLGDQVGVNECGSVHAEAGRGATMAVGLKLRLSPCDAGGVSELTVHFKRGGNNEISSRVFLFRRRAFLRQPQSSRASSVCVFAPPLSRSRGVKRRRAAVRGGPFTEGAGSGQGGWLMDAPGYLEEGLLHSEAGQQN